MEPTSDGVKTERTKLRTAQIGLLTVFTTLILAIVSLFTAKKDADINKKESTTAQRDDFKDSADVPAKVLPRPNQVLFQLSPEIGNALETADILAAEGQSSAACKVYLDIIDTLFKPDLKRLLSKDPDLKEAETLHKKEKFAEAAAKFKQFIKKYSST